MLEAHGRAAGSAGRLLAAPTSRTSSLLAVHCGWVVLGLLPAGFPHQRLPSWVWGLAAGPRPSRIGQASSILPAGQEEAPWGPWESHAPPRRQGQPPGGVGAGASPGPARPWCISPAGSSGPRPSLAAGRGLRCPALPVSRHITQVPMRCCSPPAPGLPWDPGPLVPAGRAGPGPGRAPVASQPQRGQPLGEGSKAGQSGQSALGGQPWPELWMELKA